MAVASDVTLTGLVTESLKISIGERYDQNLYNRLYTTGINRILNKIASRAALRNKYRLKTLQFTKTAIGVTNQIRFAEPTDFDESEMMVLYYGTHTDTATAGGASSVTLAADEDVVESNADYIMMLTGTSQGQFREIIDYDETTKVATVDTAWDSLKTPVNGDTYRILDEQYLLDPGNKSESYKYSSITSGRPREYSHYKKEFYFDYKFDYPYIIYLRYYAALNKIDQSEGATTIFTQILNNWQGLLETGIQWRIAVEIGDKNTKSRYDDFISSIDEMTQLENVSENETSGMVKPCFSITHNGRSVYG